MKKLIRKLLGIDADIGKLTSQAAAQRGSVTQRLTVLERTVTALNDKVAAIKDNSVIETTIAPSQWVTPQYYCKAHGITYTYALSARLYTVWKTTHKGADPTASTYNAASYVYPAGYIRDVINGRYDHVED